MLRPALDRRFVLENRQTSTRGETRFLHHFFYSFFFGLVEPGERLNLVSKFQML